MEKFNFNYGLLMILSLIIFVIVDAILPYLLISILVGIEFVLTEALLRKINFKETFLYEKYRFIGEKMIEMVEKF